MSDKKEDLIKSVSVVFSEAIREKKQYIIPSYQRGYKWNRSNVCKLLDDLKNFEHGNASNIHSFYCIQNITIVPQDIPVDNVKGWNVVDGQQRLTTLYILLSYLKKFQNDDKLSFFSSSECLNYKVRKETGTFLREKVFTGIIWDEIIEPDKATRKDQWYILDVAKGIFDWFNLPENSLKIDTIIDRLKLIVNNMTNSNVSEEEIFAGLNGGKVDLDGADLVRAELITRSAKEKYKNGLADKVKEFRIRIALELDEMNLWWGQNEHKKYFEQFLQENLFKNSIFNHDAYPIDTLYKLYFQINHEKDETFGIEFFENGRNFNSSSDDDHWELYESLMKLHQTLHMWFMDSLLYHWIGYLIFGFKNQTINKKAIDLKLSETDKNYVVNFSLIWNIWNNSETKNDFLSKIISLIKVLITDKESEDPSVVNNVLANIKNVNKQWYGRDSKGITNVLVLMDVMLCTGIYHEYWNDNTEKIDLKILDLKEGKSRLPAAYFIKSHENFEHIRSCSPSEEEGKEVLSKGEWIEHINKIYKDEKPDSDEMKMKLSLLKILNAYTGETLDDKTIDRLNVEMNKYGQHSIGNMALLDEHVNKSYQNDPFQKKIQRIFSEYMNDKWYIRPYTMMVFEHKINDSDRSWRWTKQNIQENANNIASNIEQLLNMTL